MTKRDLTDIALKTLGLYLLILSIDSLTELDKSTSHFLYEDNKIVTEGLIYLISNVFQTCLYTLGFYILTIKTSQLTKRIIKIDTAPAAFTIDKKDLLQVLFVTAGILITFFAISEFWTQMTMNSIYNFDFLPKHKRTKYFLLLLAIPTTKGVVGLIFIFLSSGLARLLTRKNKKSRPD